MNDNTILRIKVPAHLYESVKKQLTLKENKKPLQEEISATDEELIAFYEKVKQEVEAGTDLQSAIHYAKFDMNNPDAAKELSSMNEAKKQNYGAGFSVVKEKKVKVPKDGMKKVEEDKGYMGTGYDSSEDMAVGMIKKETKDTEMEKKTRSLEELKAAKVKLDKKIEEMSSKNGVEENVNEDVTRGAEISANNMMNAISSGDPFATGVALVLGVAGAVIAGANAGAIKNTLVGWWKGLKDEEVKEKVKDFAEENNVKLG